MPLEPFKVSESLTLGVELELQLVNTTDFDLAASASDMLHLLERQPFPGDVKPEITESMIEISTDVHRRHGDLLLQLRQMRDVLTRAGDRLNVALYGYLAKQFTVFGQHVHVGCASADEALFLLHALNRYLPHFIALSASSPYSQGVDTLFDSARLNSVFAFPLSGRAPFILSWDQFQSEYFAKMEGTGVVKSMKDFYWDIRPKPEFGTIELRVCDTPLSVERAAALAGYLQILCAHLLERREPAPVEDDYLVYNYNRFQACRFGLDGVLVHPKTHERLPLREDILATLRRVTPVAMDLGAGDVLDGIYHVVAEGNHASFLRYRFQEEGSLPAVVDAAVECFRQ
ncbi:glutamate--cysteine ligase [Denitratisoma sp. DHT3]|uniref:glutamate--cysteine ligase 2 n=1 Tax=Denitratisoma sp. DHT3 TaxID=1981880 RepID=UPI0011986119|nr:glutamate--cysteine ligase [Denitratisoma sp. DHT3]QDX79990.1 glutamate--cysteine ligase [Denitratisoma sp. DHT3]